MRSGFAAQALFAALSTALAGVPLLITPGLTLYFDITPKVVLLLCVTAASLFLPRVWLDGWRVLWQDRAGRTLLVLLGAGVLSLSLSMVFSTAPAISFGGSNWRRFGLVPHAAMMLLTAVFAGFLAGNPARLHPLLRVFVPAGLLASIYGALQYSGIDPLVAPESYHVGEGEWAIVRTPGTLGHAGYFATYLLTVVFWSLALARIESSRRWKRLALATAALGSFAIVLSGTRGAMLGLLAGAVVGGVWRGPRWNRRAVAGSLLAAAALAAFYYSPPGERLRARMRWSIEDASGGGRLLLWRDSLRMSAAGSWWSGTGLETYSAAFPPYLSPELAGAYPNRYYESPHNVFLDALTSQGLPGLLFVLGISLTAAWAAWLLRKRRDAAGAWLAAAFAATFCSNQFLAFTLPTALCFYLSAALLVVVSLADPKTMERALPRWVWPAGAIVAALLGVFAFQLAAADALLARAQRDAAGGRVPAAIGAYEQARRWMPWGMNVDLWFARTMMAAAQREDGVPAAKTTAWEAARAAGERAAEYAPERQAALYNLALLYGLSDDAVRAEAALRRAIAAAPTWYKPRWMLAQLLRQTGRLQEARREAETAHALNGGANAEVTETWEQLRLVDGNGE